MSALSEWQNFYVITGSAAGALIGLQFVVLTLMASLPRRPATAFGAAVYSTPTIVHLTTVLLLSAAMVAPRSYVAHFVITGLIQVSGAAGVAYTTQTAVRMHRAPYKPEFEDWLFHAILPFIAYLLMAVSASAEMVRVVETSLYGIAVATVLLLVIGIHNAWDTVTYHVFNHGKPDQNE
ncbi:MAG TPA: hypothetical protein VKB38_06410 [Terracidiphilus sp.]|nr:hypothetical protein [Terracidiphilus sp.]